MTAKIRLLLPNMDASNKIWGSGGAFGWAECEFTVNPVGSDRLYRLTKVSHEGKELDLENVLRLNADAKAVDELIAKRIHGEYAASVQLQPIAKRARKRKVEVPPADPNQSEMPL